MDINYQRILEIINTENTKERIAKLESIRDRIDDYYLKILISNELGISYRDFQMYKNSIENYLKALNYAYIIGANKDEIGICLLNLAGTYRLDKDVEKAKLSLDKANEYISSDYTFEYASLLNYYGHYYNDTMNYVLALEYYKKSLEYIIQVNDNHMFLCNCYNNIAKSLKFLGNHKESIEYYEKVKEIYDKGNIDKGRHYLEIIIDYLEVLYEYNDIRINKVYNEIINWISDSMVSLTPKAKEQLDKIGILLLLKGNKKE